MNILKDMKPRLIKDLGMIKKEGNLRSYRYGLYECAYCGKEWETIIASIIATPNKSCGCQGSNNPKHGLRSNKFYPIWNAMLQRCNNPKHKRYKDYGARGITVCEEWLDVANFIAWVDSTHPNISRVSLDRIDNDKGYSPENCRWADATTQAINRRMGVTNTSGYVGVSWAKNQAKWNSSINLNNKHKHLGYFECITEAVTFRNQYIIDNNLNYAVQEVKIPSK